jgi:hypothetical protein
MNYNKILSFKSSIFFGGNLLSTDIIEIDDVFITLRRKSMFNATKSTSIPIANVIKIGLSKSFTGVNIFIESLAHRHFKGIGFSKKAAREINTAIDTYKNQATWSSR